jgi:two-component system, NarL family, invasion response regulator UvrY
MTVVRVLVADDHASFLAAARSVLEATEGFALVGEATSGEQAVALSGSLQPDLVLIDINMAGMSGIEAAQKIVAANPATLTILLSTYREEDLPPQARSCGAAGYVHKEAFGARVLRDLWGGRAYWSAAR